MGVVGVEIKCLINQYVTDVEFEWDAWFLCDLKPTVYRVAWSRSSRNILQLRSPYAFFIAFYCWSRCRPALFGRLCHLFGWNESGQSPNLLPYSNRRSVFCVSPLASMALRFLEENACVNVFLALTVNWWWSWLQACICSGNSAAFCDWLLRKCKSSSWPALPFPLLCWEESLWLLIVQIWLSFTLKDKIFTDGLWNLCSFKKYSWSLWPESKGHTDPLIYLNK